MQKKRARERIIMFLCIISLLFTPVLAASQSNAMRVSLDLKSATVKEFFDAVKVQTGLNFIYSTEQVKNMPRITIQSNSQPISEVLNKVLANTGYSYEIEGNIVTIVYQQPKENVRTATGVVVDEGGLPLPGAYIKLSKTEHSTITDNEGKFSINLFHQKEPVLIVSYLGMIVQEVKVAGTKPMTIVMKSDVKSIDEVVVTGYQEIDRRKLASSISSIKGADLIGGEYLSIDKMLQGRLPGVAVMNMSSTPGATPKIRIRGSSSITGNREPVWVVDGIILEEPVNISTEELNSPDKINLIGNAIGSVNPEDIERVDILKDASATAIYGIKAANGVIVVTTKQGKSQKPSISYTATLGITAPPTYDKMFRMNSADRIDMSIEMQERGLSFGSYKPSDIGYEGALQHLWNKDITYQEFLNQVKTLKGLNTDWYDLLFRTAFTHQHSVSITGGNDRSNYYMSMGYANNNSVTIGEGLERYNVLAKINTRINRNIHLGLKVSGSLSKAEHPHTSIDVYEYAYNTSRAIPLRTASNELYFYANEAGRNGVLSYNIMNELNHTGNKNDNSAIDVAVNLDWKVASWMRFSSILGLSRSNVTQENWGDEQSYYISSMRQSPYGKMLPNPIEDSEFAERYCLLPFGGELMTTNTRNTSYTWRNSLSLMQSFGKHEVSGSIGQEVRSSKYDGLSSTQYGYLPERGKKFVDIDPTVWKRYGALVKSHPDVVTDTKNNVISLYATAAYVYDSRYILNFNIRTDGSNKFGQSKSVRFLPIWSVSTRWNVINEKFMKNVDFLNDLAIRASYGIQGNVHPDQTPNLIASLGTLESMPQEYISTLYKLPNNKLKWEKTNSYNIAIDWAFWNNRIYGSLDVYYKKGVDQVVTKNVAPSTGASSVSINDGDVENKGWDLAVSFVPIQTRDWMWSLSFNTGKNYNKVLNAGNSAITWQDYIAGTLVSNGNAINSFYSYKFDKLDDQGFPTFKDINEKDEEGNAVVHSLQEMYDRAFVLSGKREPDLTGGFSTYLKYKNITFNALFSFSFGNKMRLNDLYESSGQRLPYPDQNMSSEFVNRWREPGDEDRTIIPVLSDKSLQINDKDVTYRIADNGWDMYNKSDIRVVSGSFLRCRSMSIRYDFKREWLKPVYLKGASVSFDMGNVFVIKDKALKGRDPEQIGFGSRSIPPQRSYSLRFNITL
ncbi:TonB-dependent receptor [Bacteroides thetaiotaomicron]|uniref:TonB-dependent receptor n=1 Tax=Bacteroides thetaiotaomicron TaxID=818 RepID=UPI0006D53888